jgi:hypothetical protein
MPDSFSSINGDNLSPVEAKLRLRMIEEIRSRLKNNDCCRGAPDWDTSVYALSYKKLCKRYENIFGHPIDKPWPDP